MRNAFMIVWAGLAWSVAHGQTPAPIPIADNVAKPLLPSGISEMNVTLDGKLAFLFKDDDGTEAAHILGGFSLTLGGENGQTLRSHEAVVWMSPRTHDGRNYQALQVLLWRSAEVREAAGTLTTAPALFVTLNTFGKVDLNVDDVTLESSAHTSVYREGNLLRKGISNTQTSGRDEDVALRVFDPSGLSSKKREPKIQPVIHFQSRGEFTMSRLNNGAQVMTVIGGVYLARGVPGSDPFMEIQADSVVVFLSPDADVAPPTPVDGQRSALPGSTTLGPSLRPQTKTAQTESGPTGQMMATALGDVAVEAAYLEGDVVLTQGSNMIRASRLFYEFTNDRAVIMDAMVRTTIAKRNIPLYVRAAEIRQHSTNHFSAIDAILTTSEFHTPHYHVGAASVELINQTPADPSGGGRGQVRAGTFRIDHATLNVNGIPIAYWPFIRGNLNASETSIRGVRTGFSNKFGLELETDWNLFNLLNLETPTGVDATLSLDYFTERGPAIGIEADYSRDRYFGEIKSYLLADGGEDFLGREREIQSRKDTRGRFSLRHRHYLDDDWQVSLELSYLSDRDFLEEFFESEFDDGKDQETLLYIKKQRDNWAFTGLLQYRILDFTTQTERLPDFSFHVAGQPVGDRFTWYSENRVGVVRHRTADQTFRELLLDGRLQGSGSVNRLDSRQEFGAPFDLGPVRLVPFVSVRGSAWDDSLGGGGLGRAMGTLGVRGSTYLWRLYPDFHSSLFDVRGLRHLIKTDVTAWVSGSNRDPQELFPFDETVEGIESHDGVTLGIRQRWQTKRGEGDNRRLVDFLTLDVDFGFFNDIQGNSITNGFASFSRPENSIARNYANATTVWRINDRTALLSEANVDLNDGQLDVYNVSLAVERSPRLSYLLGYRFIEESDSNLLGFDLNYRLNEKHTLAVRESFDLQEGRTLDFTVALVRKFPRWFGAVSFALDEAEDDFGVSFSIWPEGLPQAALGSRRFTRLATTTSLARD